MKFTCSSCGEKANYVKEVAGPTVCTDCFSKAAHIKLPTGDVIVKFAHSTTVPKGNSGDTPRKH